MSGDARPSHTTRDIGDLKKGTLQGGVFRGLRAVLLAVGRVLLRFEIAGEANVPMEGGLIVVSNHLHNADPVLISIACPRPVHYMAKSDLFRLPGISWAISRAGAFPVERDRMDRHALRMAQATLEQGIALGIFPEGTRSRSHRIEQVHDGVGMFALRASAPIVPVTITGSEFLPLNGAKNDRSRGRRWRPTVRIVFGEPFTLPTRDDGSRLGVKEATEHIMRRVAGMLPPEYRGIYASSSPANDSARTLSGISSDSSPS